MCSVTRVKSPPGVFRHIKWHTRPATVLSGSWSQEHSGLWQGEACADSQAETQAAPQTKHSGLTARSLRSVAAAGRPPVLCVGSSAPHQRLSESMSGSLGPACVFNGCPIRTAPTLNCVCLIRKDRASNVLLTVSRPWSSTQWTGSFSPESSLCLLSSHYTSGSIGTCEKMLWVHITEMMSVPPNAVITMITLNVSVAVQGAPWLHCEQCVLLEEQAAWRTAVLCLCMTSCIYPLFSVTVYLFIAPCSLVGCFCVLCSVTFVILYMETIQL